MQVDYLAIGHVSADLSAEGPPRLGGTVTFSALTAQALGLRPAIVTSAPADAPLLRPLAGVAAAVVDAPHPTTFENVYTAGYRTQTLLHHAAGLTLAHVPSNWRAAPLVHLAPVAREVDPALAGQFPGARVCVTPQGWMREWDGAGRVAFSGWPGAETTLGRADAVVLSIDDVEGNETLVESFARHARLLAVTRGAAGCSLYAAGTRTDIPAPTRTERDPTGAGDIFATAFFVSLHQTGDALRAARLATRLAGQSVEREGLAGIPTLAEVQAARADLP